MTLSRLSLPYFPVEGTLRAAGVARRKQALSGRLAATRFGSGSPTGTRRMAKSGTFDPSSIHLDRDAWASKGGTTEPDTSGSRWPGGWSGGHTYTPVSYYQAPAPEDMDTHCVTCEKGAASCHRNIEGDDAICSDLAPVDSPFSRLDFISASSSDAADKVSIDDGFTSEETDLLLKAWALLVQSTDLVKWAVCWITGKPATGDCIVNQINGAGTNVHIKAHETTGSFWETGWLASLWGGGTINIAVLGSDWLNYVDIWRCGETSGAEPVDKMCAAVDLSATLLHELTHSCIRAWRDSDHANECYTSYLIENAFRWAIFHRYQDAASSTCCTGVADDKVFGSSGAKYPNTGCVSCTSSTGTSGTSTGTSASADEKNWWLEHHTDKPGSGLDRPERS